MNTISRNVFKIITPYTRQSLDKIYINNSWYKIIRKHKLDQVGYPYSDKTINKMNSLSRKYFYINNRVVDTIIKPKPIDSSIRDTIVLHL